VVTERTESVELGTSAHTEVRRGSGMIQWLGREILVEAFISNEPLAAHRPDMARALIGTELLAGCLLLVDFAARLVEIETQV
jgi:hypothetical protein